MLVQTLNIPPVCQYTTKKYNWAPEFLLVMSPDPSPIFLDDLRGLVATMLFTQGHHVCDEWSWRKRDKERKLFLELLGCTVAIDVIMDGIHENRHWNVNILIQWNHVSKLCGSVVWKSFYLFLEEYVNCLYAYVLACINVWICVCYCVSLTGFFPHQEKMPIPSVVIEPASSNEGDDDRDIIDISPTTISDNGVTADTQTAKDITTSDGPPGLPPGFLYKVFPGPHTHTH